MFSDPMFSGRSLWTMVHGIGLSGGALLGLAAALFYLYAATVRDGGVGRTVATSTQSRPLTWLSVLTALLLWLSVLVGTYIVFPAYRATPPAGATDLAAYPRALILADPSNAWLHTVAMEIKEHVPFIAAMLATAVAFVAVRERERLLNDETLRRAGLALLGIAFALVGSVALLGTLVNKFAPLE